MDSILILNKIDLLNEKVKNGASLQQMLDSIPNDSADETAATETAAETSEPHARRGIVRDSKRSYAQLLDFVRRNPFSDFCPTGESIS